MTTDDSTTDTSPYPETEDGVQRIARRGLSTLTELTAALAGERAAIRDAERALETAAAAYTSATRAAAYSDEALAAAQRHHEPILAAVEQSAARVAGDAQDAARAILASLPPDRIVVDPAVEALAATRAVLLRQVIATASIEQLRDQLKSAVVAGDQASAFVFAALLPARLAAAPATSEAGAAARSGRRGRSSPASCPGSATT